MNLNDMYPLIGGPSDWPTSRPKDQWLHDVGPTATPNPFSEYRGQYRRRVNEHGNGEYVWHNRRTFRSIVKAWHVRINAWGRSTWVGAYLRRRRYGE